MTKHAEPIPFGVRLRQLREQFGLTQAELAERAGVTTQAISALERGARRQPYPHTVKALADALGLHGVERDLFLGSRLVEPEVTAAPPPLVLPPASFHHNLPAHLSSFVGRSIELQELRGLLRSHRLVTLVGPGGAGKTRLAQAAADVASEYFSAGLRLIELADFSDPAFLPGAIARALGIVPNNEADTLAAIQEYLRERTILLLLDNCEHLIDACAALVDRLLVACPYVHICATSREVLRLPGERIYPVPPLRLPDAQAVPAPDELVRYDAIKLFVERAAALQADFRLNAENAPAIATICRRLEGIPLAIELAAARIRSMPPQQLVERLSQSLRLLTGGSRAAPARQQTLRGTLDWSYNLLEAGERILFRRLSVFAGGWDLAAAEAVGVDSDSHVSVAELLAQLIDQSLVQVDPGNSDGVARYRMLEPVRQYALQLLEESGELDAIRLRHAVMVCELAEQAQPELRRAGQMPWLNRLSLEHDNIRAALDWAIRAGEVTIAARIAWSIWAFWWIRAYQAEGRRWLEQILAHQESLPPVLHLRTMMAYSTMSYGTGDLGLVSQLMDDLLVAAERIGGDTHAESYAVMGKGLLALERGDATLAAYELARSIPLLEASGEAGIAAQMRVFLGTTHLLRGDAEAAAVQFQRSLVVAQSLGDRLSISNAFFSLAQLALHTAAYPQAIAYLRAGIPIAQEMGDPAGIAFIIEMLAIVAARQNDDLRAAQLLGASDGLRERIGLRGHTYYGSYRPLYAEDVAQLRVRLAARQLTVFWEAGRNVSFAQAIELARG